MQTSGRSGESKMRQRLSSVNCVQRTPAGLPCGMPGIGDEIERAIQQAPQPIRQSNEHLPLAIQGDGVAEGGGSAPISINNTQPMTDPPWRWPSTRTHSRLKSSKRRSAGKNCTATPAGILPTAVKLS
jgi:hypothetical protein